MAANVSVRFSVQDAETVRKALQDIGNDGKAALDKLDAASRKPGAGLSLLSSIVEGARTRLLGLAVPLGPVGEALISMGPAGLVAAAGLGVVMTAMGKLSELAEQQAAKSQKLQTLAEVTQLSTNEIQALTDQTQKYGVSQDDTTTAIQRATVAWDQLRRGQGEAYDEIRKISPELLNQLASVRTFPAALDLLAEAWRKAGDAAQRNSLSRAFFGARNANAVSTGTAILGGISEGGGLAQISKETVEAGGAIDKDLIPRLVKLRNEIDDIKERTQNVWGSMFAEHQLQSQKEAAELMERLAAAVKGVKENAGDWITRGVNAIAQSEGVDSEAPKKVIVDTPPTPPPLPVPRPTPAVPVEVRLREQRDLVSALGAAVTPTEQLKLRTLELENAQKNSGLSASNSARAYDASKNSIMQTIEATRERLGVASEEQIVEARLAQLRQEQARGVITDANDIARAEQLIQKEARAAAEALQIRASNYPGLKQLELDASNLNKTLDQGATEGINNITNELASLSSGTESVGQGFTNMKNSVLNSINQIAYKLTVGRGLSVALQSLFNAFLPANGRIPGPVASAYGNVFSGPGISAFSNRVVSRPTIFPFAKGIGLMGEDGEEGILPLTRINGKLGVHAVGGGGSPDVNISISSPAPLERQSTSTDSQGNRNIDLVFQKAVERVGVDSIVGGDMGRAIAQKFGAKPFSGT